MKEREAGTIEQLLMSPAGTYEIIVAKIAPLFLVLFLMVVFATVLIKVAFDVPFQGSIFVLLSGSALCVLGGIGIGTVIATFTHSAFQAQLTSFFVNPLFTTASGAITPAEAIPNWLQPLVKINPIRHFSVIARSSMIKGSGFADALAELSGALDFRVHHDIGQRLALPETTQLGTMKKRTQFSICSTSLPHGGGAGGFACVLFTLLLTTMRLRTVRRPGRLIGRLAGKSGTALGTNRPGGGGHRHAVAHRRDDEQRKHHQSLHPDRRTLCRKCAERRQRRRSPGSFH